MLLELKNVKKVYKLGNKTTFPAIMGIDISFDYGELVSIIGESGSGKSTLMNIIGGLDSDFTGSVKVEGKDILKFSEKELDKYRKNKIGFVFQSFNLIPHLSVLDNVTIAMALSNVGAKERKKRAMDILIEVGLKDHMNKKPNQLSGGQKQRVAIARALINEPDIILADEPTGSLDSETSVQILKLITDIAAQGKLVIMVTHSSKVAAISSRVVSIKDGLITDDKINYKTDNKLFKSDIIKKDKQNLSFFSAIKLSFKNMQEKKARNLLVSIGASIGIMSVVLMLSMGSGVKSYITNTMQGYVNPLVVEVDHKDPKPTGGANSSGPQGFMNAPAIPFTTEEIAKLSAIKNVTKVEKGYSLTSYVNTKVTYNKIVENVLILGTMSSNITSSNIVKGNAPKANEILLSETLAKLYGVDMIGKLVKVDLLIDTVKITVNVKVSGLYGSSDASSMQQMNQVYFNYSDLEVYAKNNGVILKPTTIYLLTTSKTKADVIKKEIITLGFQGSRTEQLLNTFTQMLSIITYVLTAIAAISLVVSSIMILVVLYISVVERTREIGVLKAIGARKKDIKTIFVSESFLIGLASGIIGVMFSSLLIIIIDAFIKKSFNISLIGVNLQYCAFGVAVSVIVSMIAGLYPASMAAKLDPVESLRRE